MKISDGDLGGHSRPAGDPLGRVQGAVHRVVVDCGFLLTALVTTHAVVELGLVPGCQTVASIKATAIHAIRR